MNNQEQAMQGMIEFCKWLIPNAKQLGLENSKGVQKIASAKDSNGLVDAINFLYKELGEEQFTALTKAFEHSKTQNIQTAKNGAKIDYLVNKFATGGPFRDTVEVHEKWRLTPLWMSIAAANGVDVPKKHYTHDPREFKYIKSPNGQRWGIIQNKNNGQHTIFELDHNNEPISSEFGGQKYEYGDEMFDRHVNNYKYYTKEIFIPSDKNGGIIDANKLWKYKK